MKRAKQPIWCRWPSSPDFHAVVERSVHSSLAQTTCGEVFGSADWNAMNESPRSEACCPKCVDILVAQRSAEWATRGAP